MAAVGKSTGPTSAQGKATAAANTDRLHGWTPELKAERAAMLACRAAVEDLLRQQRDLL